MELSCSLSLEEPLNPQNVSGTQLFRIQTDHMPQKTLLSEAGVAIALVMTNGLSTPVSLRDPADPHTTLGCVKAPNGDQSFQAAALCKKSKDIAKKSSSNHTVSRRGIHCLSSNYNSVALVSSGNFLALNETAGSNPKSIHGNHCTGNQVSAKTQAGQSYLGPPEYGGYGLTSLGSITNMASR